MPSSSFDSRAVATKTRGESKEELLARAAADRAARAKTRETLRGVLAAQAAWRGRRERATTRASLLASWDARFATTVDPPSAREALARLLPPVLHLGASRVGAARLLRVFALLIASLNARESDVNYASLACDADPATRDAWTTQARRVAALALGVLVEDETSTVAEFETTEPAADAKKARERREALPAVAARLVTMLHDASAWRCHLRENVCGGGGGDEDDAAPGPGPSSTAAAAALVDPATPAGARQHVRACVALARLAARGDDNAAALAKVVVDAVSSGGESGGGTGTRAVTRHVLTTPLLCRKISRETAAALASPRFLVAALGLVVAEDEDCGRQHVLEGLENARASASDGDGDMGGETSSHAPEVWLLDNVLALATGWRSGGTGRGSARDARERLRRFRRGGRDDDDDDDDDGGGGGGGGGDNAALLARACEVLVARAQTKGAWAWGSLRDVRRRGALGLLEEVWFLVALGGGAHADAADDADDETTASAIESLYWRLLAGATATDARQLLGAVAFAPDALARSWRRVSARLPAPRELPMTERGMGAGAGAWTAPTLTRGVADVPRRELPALGVFCLAYAHLLLVLDDDEFYSAQKPFSLSEQRGIAVAVNTIVVRTHLTPGGNAFLTRRRAGSGAEAEDARERARLMRGASALSKALRTRDSRRKFAPVGLWLAPAADAAARIPVAAAASALAAHLRGGGSDGKRTTGGKNATTRGKTHEKTFADGDDLDADADAASFDEAASAVGAGLLVDCPHALPFEYRVRIFRELVKEDRRAAGYGAQAGGADANPADLGQRVRPVAEITIRRDLLLEDALAQIPRLGDAIRGRLAVRYVNAAGGDEAGIDAGGLFKELVSDVLAAGFDPSRGVFASAPSDGALYPCSDAGDTREGLEIVELMGTMTGKALYEGILAEANLAHFFSKALLGAPRTIDDLPSLDPELHRSLIQVLRYDGDVERDLALDWTVEESKFGAVAAFELRPNGANVPVTSDNRMAYVHAVADFYLNARRARANDAFARGLSRCAHPGWLRLFETHELSLLLCGCRDDWDVEDLRTHARYSGGYDKSSKSVAMFWSAVRSMDAAQRRALLKFTTGSTRPPVQGFKHLHPPFTIHKVVGEHGAFAAFGFGADVARLPSASTCFNTLKLPNYRRSSTMREKLRYALAEGKGFELS